MTSITLQPLVTGQTSMSPMKSNDVIFYPLAVDVICYERLQSDRPQCLRVFVGGGQLDSKTHSNYTCQLDYGPDFFYQQRELI